MKVMIADEDESGNTVITREETDLERIAEPSAVFWQTKEQLEGKMTETSRRAFIENGKKWFGMLE